MERYRVDVRNGDQIAHFFVVAASKEHVRKAAKEKFPNLDFKYITAINAAPKNSESESESDSEMVAFNYSDVAEKGGTEEPDHTFVSRALLGYAWLSALGGLVLFFVLLPEKPGYYESYGPDAFIPSTVALVMAILQGLLFAGASQALQFLMKIERNTSRWFSVGPTEPSATENMQSPGANSNVQSSDDPSRGRWLSR